MPPRAGAGSRAIALASLRGFSWAGYLGQARWVWVSIAGFGTGSIIRLWVVVKDLGGVPNPLFGFPGETEKFLALGEPAR